MFLLTAFRTRRVLQFASPTKLPKLPIQTSVPSTVPTDPSSHEALRIQLPRTANSYGFAQEVLSIWRQTSNQALWVATRRDVAQRISVFEYPIGGIWGRGRRCFLGTDRGHIQYPGREAGRSRRRGDRQPASRHFGLRNRQLGLQPVRPALLPRAAGPDTRGAPAPDHVLGRTTSRWTRRAFSCRGTHEQPSIPTRARRKAPSPSPPNVQATIPDALDLVLSVAEPDRGSGTILIGMDATDSFRPGEIQVAGRERGRERADRVRRGYVGRRPQVLRDLPPRHPPGQRLEYPGGADRGRRGRLRYRGCVGSVDRAGDATAPVP